MMRKLLSLGSTIVFTIVFGLLLGSYFDNMAAGIFGSIIFCLLYLFYIAFGRLK